MYMTYMEKEQDETMTIEDGLSSKHVVGEHEQQRRFSKKVYTDNTKPENEYETE